MSSIINHPIFEALPHEKFEVRQVAKFLVKPVNEVTATGPGEECSGLVEQMRRTSISVRSDLADGGKWINTRDQARFSQGTFGSLLELDMHLQPALDLDSLTESRCQEIRQSVIKRVIIISVPGSCQRTRAKQ
ncbi:MAG: four helix bundle protein [Nitrosomonas sp.]|nr:four helix bundle protein [Nitrosomonas sp.]MDP1951376.1 four helix bundle protein [Nitrosomonas sp.]